MPKRPEITPADFAKALGVDPIAVIPFDPQLFGTAANNGQMIAEVSRQASTTAEMFRQLAQVLTGRAEAKTQKAGLLTCFLTKLRKQVVSTGGVQVVFGKRSQTSADSVRRARAATAGAVQPAPRRRAGFAAPPQVAAHAATGRAPLPAAGLGAPLISPPLVPQKAARRRIAELRTDTTALGELLRDQEHDLLGADRHDRSVAARPARRRSRARGNPRHRQRHHRDQEHRDVDRRAGGTARGHLQRRARLRPARAAAGARRHRRHHGQRRRARSTSKSPARSSRPASASATTSSC